MTVTDPKNTPLKDDDMAAPAPQAAIDAGIPSATSAAPTEALSERADDEDGGMEAYA